jgi:hypothetical protein
MQRRTKSIVDAAELAELTDYGFDPKKLWRELLHHWSSRLILSTSQQARLKLMPA